MLNKYVTISTNCQKCCKTRRVFSARWDLRRFSLFGPNLGGRHFVAHTCLVDVIYFGGVVVSVGTIKFTAKFISNLQKFRWWKLNINIKNKFQHNFQDDAKFQRHVPVRCGGFGARSRGGEQSAVAAWSGQHTETCFGTCIFRVTENAKLNQVYSAKDLKKCALVTVRIAINHFIKLTFSNLCRPFIKVTRSAANGMISGLPGRAARHFSEPQRGKWPRCSFPNWGWFCEERRASLWQRR